MTGHLRCPSTQIVAVCDLHAGHMANARRQFGGDKVLAYHDYRGLSALLAR
jgi:hypothetical protein